MSTSAASGRGALRVYLGSAPGVGKTLAMLEEGARRAARGACVVVGLVETHGRPNTEQAIGSLEVIPRRAVPYRGTILQEMDLAAVLARRPDIALVDELAHTNAPGSANPLRWQDVQALLEAGIDVITTVNIQHLESVNDVVERITGVPQRETVPDAVVRAAEQIHLVDQTPEALRRRMAHGNIYPPERVDAALASFFRPGNLIALRELALLWLADRVEEGLQRYRAAHDIDATWETRERVVVALTGGPEGATLIRRASRVASRSGGELLAVHVLRSDGLSGASTGLLAQQRSLAEQLGGTYHAVIGNNVGEALVDFARGVNATQLVVGASRRSRLSALLGGEGVGTAIVRLADDIDVHMVTHESAASSVLLPRVSAALSRERVAAGFAVTALGVPLLGIGLDLVRDRLTLPSEMLAFLLLTVGVALVGGIWPALTCAVVSSVVLNWFFTPPLRSLTIADPDNLIALIAFVAVAATVAWLVARSARRTQQAARASAEAHTLATIAGSVLRGADAVEELLERVREAFGLRGATLFARTGGTWAPIASAGARSERPAESDVVLEPTPTLRLALAGGAPSAQDRRILEVFAMQAAAAVQAQQLRTEASAAAPAIAADRTRTALLAAVSHDLRTPLSSAKAAVSSLRDTAVPWTDEDRAELLATADESLDALTRLVENLLDMSRLQAGAMAVHLTPIDAEDAVSRALDDLGPAGATIAIRLAGDLPPLLADPGLLERVLVNLLRNALRHSPPDRPPAVSASAHAQRVELRIVDCGPGVPVAARDRMFVPFQRLGDTRTTDGVGLGLALARGLTEAMGGTLEADDTPGGGLTMTVSLPAGG